MTSDRDQSIERMLRRSLRGRAEPASDAPCLDAETLAAWVDGGLSASQMALAEEHAARCSRCQAMLGAIGRSTPPVSQPQPWWRREFGLRWVVPITAGVAAVVLWIAVPRESPPALESRSAAVEPSPAAAAIDQSPSSRSRAAENERQPSSLDGQGTRAEEAREARKVEAPSDRKPASVDEATRQGQLADSAAATPAAAPPMRALESAAGSDRENLFLNRASGDLRVIASPDPNIRWRIGGPGVVQFSADGGASWEDRSTGVAEAPTAGAAPAASVCWLVGRQGMVLRTTDGRRWQRASIPDAADLTAVQAIDALTASVTTVDGRVFRTADGGNTWDSAPPQEF